MEEGCKWGLATEEPMNSWLGPAWQVLNTDVLDLIPRAAPNVCETQQRGGFSPWC